MTDTINVAVTLRHVFTRFHNVILNSTPNQTIFGVWTQLFGGNGRSDFEVVQSIADILAAVNKLDSQINSSKFLDEVARYSAMETTGSFRVFLNFQIFSRKVSDFTASCNPSLLGNLGILALSLRGEFPEQNISSNEADEIKASLIEIKELILTSKFEDDIRVNLCRQIDVMIWSMSNPNFVTIQDVFERSGVAILIAEQIESRMSENEAEVKSVNSLVQKISAVASALAKIVGFTVRNAENIEKIGAAYSSLVK